MSIRSSKNVSLGVFASMLIALVLALGLAVSAQAQSETKEKTRPSTESQEMAGKQKAEQSATLTASLIDPEMNAKEKTATVQVQVTGVKLIDPALTNKKPTKGEGHLHYQVDSGPVIATTTEKLSFHGLTSGKHKILVMLANNDHSPAGPQQVLEITVP